MDSKQIQKISQDKLKFDNSINIHRLKAILKILKNKNGRLLDIGCSDGRYIVNFIKKGFICDGIDISDKAIALGKKRGLNLKKIDITKKIKISDESYEIIVCAQVLEHLIDPFFTLKEMYRILKKNGTIIITVPNIGMIRNIFLILLGKPPAYSCVFDGFHFRDYCEKEIIRMLEKANFNDIKVHGDKLNIPYWKGKLITLNPVISRYCDNLVVEARK
ncbi:MAG: class I SAM-dependent methyltransferase [Candidatus Woesearchaeota archaeon]